MIHHPSMYDPSPIQAEGQRPPEQSRGGSDRPNNLAVGWPAAPVGAPAGSAGGSDRPNNLAVPLGGSDRPNNLAVPLGASGARLGAAWASVALVRGSGASMSIRGDPGRRLGVVDQGAMTTRTIRGAAEGAMTTRTIWRCRSVHRDRGAAGWRQRPPEQSEVQRRGQ